MGPGRLVATEFLLRLGWPGAVGLVLLVAAVGYATATLLPAQRDLASLRDRAARAERQAAARSAPVPPPLSAADRRREFFAALPAQDEVTQVIERIYVAAAAEHLSLLHGEYTGADLPATGLVRYQIVLPLQGSYGQVRRFAAAAAAAVPGLVLDDLSLQRQHVGEAQVEARAQLSLFLVKQR
jgi:Tfp pilus assembly protein PilO